MTRCPYEIYTYTRYQDVLPPRRSPIQKQQTTAETTEKTNRWRRQHRLQSHFLHLRRPSVFPTRLLGPSSSPSSDRFRHHPQFLVDETPRQGAKRPGNSSSSSSSSSSSRICVLCRNRGIRSWEVSIFLGGGGWPPLAPALDTTTCNKYCQYKELNTSRSFTVWRCRLSTWRVSQSWYWR